MLRRRFLSVMQPLVRAASNSQSACSTSRAAQSSLSGLRTRNGASLETQAGSPSPVTVTSKHVKNSVARVENFVPESVSSQVALPTAAQMASWTPVQGGGSARAFSSTPASLGSSHHQRKSAFHSHSEFFDADSGAAPNSDASIMVVGIAASVATSLVLFSLDADVSKRIK